jgi:hypothetical protein
MIIFEGIAQEPGGQLRKRQNYLHFIWSKFKGKFSLVVTKGKITAFY